MTIRVVLADDQALLRATFRLLLDASPDVEVVAEAATGAEAVRCATLDRPDVVVMDIRMPELDGIEATRRICADPALAGVRVLVLTTFEEDDLVVAAVQAGASGFLGKGVEPAGLLDAIRTVAAGEELLSAVATRAVIRRVVEQPARPRVEVPGVADLTDREREVVALVAAGLSNAEIGERLFISPATAKTHVNRAMAKTAARDRAQLVVFAYESGLVDRSA
ncbi:response regulator transcription factor [Actinotalea sp. M2MS4P-6]|uniref:response regulator transcription factor n=1 Tax=Actinotalea sp. M2MS4P-6 TaxID=2983762 RepID=UPI0021E47833|nr:response regulator transcription factor [Actinotalea sp. M2MS4P-6]MCV2395693.1 response regulator transcription factor [Actinotalea sp. M2MS4P-6]